MKYGECVLVEIKYILSVRVLSNGDELHGFSFSEDTLVLEGVWMHAVTHVDLLADIVLVSVSVLFEVSKANAFILVDTGVSPTTVVRRG